MEDKKIVQLFCERSQQAIAEVQDKYGDKLRRLAMNLLNDSLDAEECVNDACLGAWNAIPPERPDPLLPYLCKITRNLALSRFRYNTAQKRGGFTFDVPYGEIEELIESGRSPEREIEAKELGAVINRFVARLTPKDRQLFLGRYWFGENYDTLAMQLGMTANACTVRVARIRKKLKAYLTQKGVL